MTLDPLLSAPAVIQAHAFAAMGAFVVGLVQFAGAKGTGLHRAVGWAWVGLMATTILASLFISSMPVVGPFGPIHLLSAWTLAVLPIAVFHARRGRVEAHRSAMIWLFLGALVVAGAFTLLPHRIMGRVVFG